MGGIMSLSEDLLFTVNFVSYCVVFGFIWTVAAVGGSYRDKQAKYFGIAIFMFLAFFFAMTETTLLRWLS
jgi:hypothetical protein